MERLPVIGMGLKKTLIKMDLRI